MAQRASQDRSAILRAIFCVALLVPMAALVGAQRLNGEEPSWCGNTIFDPTKPKGLTDWARGQLEKSARTPNAFPKGPVFGEAEPNDTRQTANLVSLATGAATITGFRDTPISPPAPTDFTAPENNDSIGTATPIGLAASVTNGRRVVSAQIGDGQFGGTSGDFDFYSFTAEPGELVLFDVTTTDGLDPIAAIYNAGGQLLLINDDEVPFSKFDPYFTTTPEVAGTYYLCIAGVARNPQSANFPQNPQQPGTGRGAGSTGAYSLTVHRLTPLVSAFENNGTISEAIPIIGEANALAEFIIEGFIGDAPVFSGDFDLFRFQAAQGQRFTFDVTTPDPFASASLDPAIGVYNSFGTIIAAHGDEDPMGTNKDALLHFTAPSAGTYYLVIGAQLIGEPFLELNFPDNPFLGIGSGAGSTGWYTIIVTTGNKDPDWLQFDLVEGQVFSARALGGVTSLGTVSPGGAPRAYSAFDVNSLGAPGSPFPRGGSSHAFVVPSTGRYAMELRSDGVLLPDEPWQVDIVVSDPGMTAKPVGSRQILFLDFDGATLNASVVMGPDELRALTPLAGFLANWGIPAQQESQLIDKIIQVVEENLSADMKAVGGNGDYVVTGAAGDFALTILNSRDHPDPFGLPNVSRVIIGGTMAQLGVETIGIAQSIDPGNYQSEETAVVLLDLVSREASDPNSFNQFAITGGNTKVDLVGVGIGNIASHEAGHFFGNWHTINDNAQPNIQDKGGIIANSLGVGADNIFGSPDDIDLDCVQDEYDRQEVYTSGTEDTLKATVYGLSTGTLPGIYRDILANDVFYTAGPGGDVISIAPGAAPNSILLDDNGLTGSGPQGIAGVQSLVVSAGGGNDAVTVSPSASVSIFVRGGTHTSADTLVYIAPPGSSVPDAQPPSGLISAFGFQNVSYEGFEQVVIERQANPLDLWMIR